MGIGARKIELRSNEAIKVLVADDDYQVARRLSDYLNDRGFDARAVNNGQDAKNEIYRFQPRFVIADLMLRGANGFQLLKYIQSDPTLRHLKIETLIISGHNSEQNVRDAFKRGAKDYMIRPITFDDILARLILHCRQNKIIEKPPENVPEDKSSNPGVLLQLFDLLLSQSLSDKAMAGVMYNFTRMAALKAGAVRCSVIRCVTQSHGIVMASNDSKKISGFKLNLNKYPEVQVVINTRETLAIENIESNSQLNSVKSQLKSFSFDSIIVSPIFYKNQIFGVLSVRMPDTKIELTDDQIRFVDVVAKSISLYLGQHSVEQLTQFGPTLA